jgi:hypothetical protein
MDQRNDQGKQVIDVAGMFPQRYLTKEQFRRKYENATHEAKA